MTETKPTVEWSDEALARALLAGNREAEVALDRRWRQRLEHYARAIVHDATLAEDVAQIALWRVHLSVERFDGSRPFEPWLLTIVRNVAISLLRQRKHDPSSANESAEPAGQTIVPVVSFFMRRILSKRVLEITPRVRCLFSSGYPQLLVIPRQGDRHPAAG